MKTSAITQIQFVTVHHQHTWCRQLSAERFARDNIRFCFGDDNLESCDYCVVYDESPAWFTKRITLPKHKAIFVAGEPGRVRKYPQKFLAQFGTVITSDHVTPHPRRLFMQQGLPWHIGVHSAKAERIREVKYRHQPMTIDTLRTYSPIKNKLVSVVCSNKTMIEGHRERLAFVSRLRDHFGTRLDMFGRGINTFVDKEEVLAPYRYHIALENCNDKDYWTEKISDPILALTYPIYYGCVNLEEYLSRDSFTRIDIARPEEAIATIEKVIASDKDKTSQDALQRARQLILDEYNIFPLLAKVVKELQRSTPQAGDSSLVTICDHDDLKQRRGLRKAVWLMKRTYHARRHNRLSSR